MAGIFSNVAIHRHIAQMDASAIDAGKPIYWGEFGPTYTCPATVDAIAAVPLKDGTCEVFAHFAHLAPGLLGHTVNVGRFPGTMYDALQKKRFGGYETAAVFSNDTDEVYWTKHAELLMVLRRVSGLDPLLDQPKGSVGDEFLDDVKRWNAKKNVAVWAERVKTLKPISSGELTSLLMDQGRAIDPRADVGDGSPQFFYGRVAQWAGAPRRVERADGTSFGIDTGDFVSLSREHYHLEGNFRAPASDRRWDIEEDLASKGTLAAHKQKLPFALKTGTAPLLTDGAEPIKPVSVAASRPQIGGHAHG